MHLISTQGALTCPASMDSGVRKHGKGYVDFILRPADGLYRRKVENPRVKYVCKAEVAKADEGHFTWVHAHHANRILRPSFSTKENN